ncbi:hypothetical protein HK098_001630 [Nowakowskiella sp. JEL0407]|nr:hypothetical protein HK098_001630 [Nowakowskiella sp. JEL0407]
MALNRTFKLKNGEIIPAFGVGTWQIDPREVGKVIQDALNIGVKLIDCAAIYGNEKEIGDTLRNAPRSSFFLVSKLWNSMHDPKDVEPAIRKTLADLGVDYLDLYLIHWPIPFQRISPDGVQDTIQDLVEKNYKINPNVTLKQTWQAMESLVDKGLVKSIGLSNFNVSRMKEILSFARIHPVVNQIELHPFFPQNQLLKFAKENEIVVQAFSPFASGQSPLLFENETVVEVAKKNVKTPAQVLISWGIQRGICVLPKSANRKRIQENFNDFILPEEDFEAISDIHLKFSKRFFNLKDFCGVNVFEDD